MDKLNYIPPKRRLTRQRSGFSVDGKHTGSESILVRSKKIVSRGSEIKILFDQKDLKIIPQFNQEIGMIGFGFFIKCDQPADVKIILEAADKKTEDSFSLAQDRWTKVGSHISVQINHNLIDVDVKCLVSIESLNNSSISIYIFGVNIDSVSYYENKEDLKKYFDEQTNLYIPEIYYLEHDKPFVVEAESTNKVEIKDGEPMVLKSCNRCGRYLPIDISDERNCLSFSNHCVKRSPCQHNAFSTYKIENLDQVGDLLKKSPIRTKISKDKKIKTYYGFQLECRVCKKYVVNAPLNPLRNAAQHREDSLRRRAAEDLLMKLFKKQWIFKSFRMKKGAEFDDYIWDKFHKKCFNCGKLLRTTNEMALDHTMPLVYFWPLDKSATCLCKTCNSKKHDYFPFEFYNKKKLIELAKITKLPRELLLDREKKLNKIALKKLISRVVWFFDDFLAQKDYQKIREEKLTADLIYISIKRVINECENGIDLIEEYKKRKGRGPDSITLG
jgi:hypothetical protein